MDYKKIEEEHVMNAETYVPLMQKTAFVNYVAERCFDRVEIRVSADDDVRTPPYFKDSPERKARYMMGALLKLYLKAGFEPVEGDEWLMSADDYDRWAGGHVFNQIERMKGNAKTRDRAFDLLADFRMLEKMLNTEVYSMLQVMNDPVTRFMRILEMQATPDALAAQLSELKKVQGELEAYAKRKRK